MRFSFTDDHLALRDAVRELLARECTAEVVRAAWPMPDGDGQGPGAGARASSDAVQSLWGHLATMGVPGLLVGEHDGGLGFDEIATALVLEETGHAAVPLPIVEVVCVGAPLLTSPPRASVESVDCTAAAWLGGSEVIVPWCADDRDVLVVRAESAGAPWTVTRTDAHAIVPVEAADGARALGRLSSDVDGSVVADGDAARLAFDRAALGTAAQLVGLARRMLEQTVAYVTERTQFGVPIGSFQAVKHHLADARLQLEFASPAVHRAAWSLATGAETAARDVSMAKAMASDAAHVAGRKALQCHGGIGYTVEYDLHLYLKRAWALERAWGDSAWHRRRIATAIGV